MSINNTASRIMTNGEAVKATYPNAHWYVTMHGEVFTNETTDGLNKIYFDLEWWNSPCR